MVDLFQCVADRISFSANDIPSKEFSLQGESGGEKIGLMRSVANRECKEQVWTRGKTPSRNSKQQCHTLSVHYQKDIETSVDTFQNPFILAGVS